MSTALKAGFVDPVFDSQAVFRSLMSATSYPGRVFTLDRTVSPPAPLGTAATALCLSLVDFETPVWLDEKARTDEMLTYLRFHCGAPVHDAPGAAAFALIADPLAMPRLADFHQGEDEYPDRAATLVIEVPSLTDGVPTTWSGPGIDGSIAPRIAGLPDWFWSDWDLNGELYPMGVDVIFACGDAVVGLPRSIKVVV